MQLHINLAASGVNPFLQLTLFMLGRTIKISLFSLTPSENLFGPDRLYNARGESVSFKPIFHWASISHVQAYNTIHFALGTFQIIFSQIKI